MRVNYKRTVSNHKAVASEGLGVGHSIACLRHRERELFRQPKVTDLREPKAREQHILGLQVAVDLTNHSAAEHSESQHCARQYRLRNRVLRRTQVALIAAAYDSC